MSFFRQLLKIELASLCLLVACAAIVAGYFAIRVSLTGDPAANEAGSMAKGMFFLTLLAGLFPVLLIGAPAFTALHHFGRATWPLTVLLGALLNLNLFFIPSHEIRTLAIACGLSIAMAIRALFGQGLKPQRSVE